MTEGIEVFKIRSYTDKNELEYIKDGILTSCYVPKEIEFCESSMLQWIRDMRLQAGKIKKQKSSLEKKIYFGQSLKMWYNSYKVKVINGN